MEIYIALFIFELLFGLAVIKKEKIYKNVYLVISFMLLAGIAAIRTENVGVDTPQYYRAYLRISNLNWSELITERYEIGFTILCKGLSYITSNPQLLIAITAIFINFSVIRFIYKYSDDYVFSILLYILLNFYFSYINIMRQAIAIAILLWAFDAMKNNKKIRYFLLVALAMTFHSSAILGLSYFILSKINYKAKYNKFVIPILAIIFLFGQEIFSAITRISPRLEGYAGSEFDTENYFGALIAFILTFCIWWFGNDILKRKHSDNFNKDLTLYNKIMIVNVITTLLTIRVGIFNRFTPYFSIFQIMWIPNVIKLINNNKQLYKLLLIIIFVIYWIVIMIFRPEWYGVVPYEMINF